MIDDEEICTYLQAERQSVRQLLELFSRKLAKIDALLENANARVVPGPVTSSRSNPLDEPVVWRSQMTSTTTLGLCREALGLFGREATATEIVRLIEQRSGVAPAKTIVSMLYKRGSKEMSGIYRTHLPPGSAKYGLLAWRKNEQPTRAGDGSFEAPDDGDIPI